MTHEPQSSWWAAPQAQQDREAFRQALAPRLPHQGNTKFGRLLGSGITAACVEVSRPVRRQEEGE